MYVMGTLKNQLNEAVLLSTLNTFNWWIRKPEDHNVLKRSPDTE